MSISHCTVEAKFVSVNMNMYPGISTGLYTPKILSLTKKIDISAFFVMQYYQNFRPSYQRSHPKTKHRSYVCQLSVVLVN